MWRFVAGFCVVFMLGSGYSTLEYPKKLLYNDLSNASIGGGLRTFLSHLRGYSITSDGDVIFCETVKDPEPQKRIYNLIKFTMRYITLGGCTLAVAFFLFLVILSQFVSALTGKGDKAYNHYDWFNTNDTDESSVDANDVYESSVDIPEAYFQSIDMPTVELLAYNNSPATYRKHVDCASEGREHDIGVYEEPTAEGEKVGFTKKLCRGQSSEICLDNAMKVRDMTKKIEYLTKINDQRENEISKLHTKNEFLVKSLSRAQKTNKRLPNQSREHKDSSKKNVGTVKSSMSGP